MLEESRTLVHGVGEASISCFPIGHEWMTRTQKTRSRFSVVVRFNQVGADLLEIERSARSFG